LKIYQIYTAAAVFAFLSAFFTEAQAAGSVTQKTDPIQSSSASHEIAFTMKAGKESKVAIMNAGITALREIASCGEGECYPNWSPDGKEIVFERHDNNGAGIYIMQNDGTGPQRLSPTPGFDVRPDFSPDGKQIIFNHVIPGLLDRLGMGGVPATEIMLMDAKGGNRRTILAANGAFNVEPRISPDGTKVAFMSNRDHSQQIYVMNIDGTGLRKITNAGSNGDPVWSHDGLYISFGSNREGDGKLNIFSMKRDGSDVRQLTHFLPPAEAGDTSWSPDGKVIAFEMDVGGKGQSDPNAYAEIWLVSADGDGRPVSMNQTCAGVGCSPRFRPQ
jgi:Tol biopolymer transport system component